MTTISVIKEKMKERQFQFGRRHTRIAIMDRGTKENAVAQQAKVNRSF